MQDSINVPLWNWCIRTITIQLIIFNSPIIIKRNDITCTHYCQVLVTIVKFLVGYTFSRLLWIFIYKYNTSESRVWVTSPQIRMSLWRIMCLHEYWNAYYILLRKSRFWESTEWRRWKVGRGKHFIHNVLYINMFMHVYQFIPIYILLTLVKLN